MAAWARQVARHFVEDRLLKWRTLATPGGPSRRQKAACLALGKALPWSSNWRGGGTLLSLTGGDTCSSLTGRHTPPPGPSTGARGHTRAPQPPVDSSSPPGLTVGSRLGVRRSPGPTPVTTER